MKQRIAQGFYYGLVFTMGAVVVKVLLALFGSGPGSVAFICLVLAGLLVVMLVDTNPPDEGEPSDE